MEGDSLWWVGDVEVLQDQDVEVARMPVRLDEAGHDRGAGCVEVLGVARSGRSAVGSAGVGDAAVDEHHGGIGYGVVAGAADQRAVLDDSRSLGAAHDFPHLVSSGLPARSPTWMDVRRATRSRPRRRVVISGVPVGHVQQCGPSTADELGPGEAGQVQQGNQTGTDHRGDRGGEQTPQPSSVEGSEAEVVEAAVEHDRGHQEAREHEEHVDTDEAVGQPGTCEWEPTTSRTVTHRTPSSRGR